MFLIIAILAFCLLILVHELGHFLASKALGVKVNEFSIGMGPALYKRRRGETLYAVRCLPVGGYCALEGEDDASDDPKSFFAQTPLKKLVILVAGVVMNFLFGLVLLLVIFSQAWGFNVPVVEAVAEDSPYVDIFEPGDRFYSIDGHRTYFTNNLDLFLSRNPTGVYDIVIQRDGEKVEYNSLEFKPYTNSEGRSGYGLTLGVERATFGTVLKNSWYSAVDCVRMVWISLGDIVRGLVGLDELSGVVGIVDTINDIGSSTAEEQGMGMALMDVGYIVAFIAVNLAVMNLLPIPGLDGGRILFVVLGAIVKLFNRKGIPLKYESWINAAGLVALLALTAVIMFNDIARLIK